MADKIPTRTKASFRGAAMDYVDSQLDVMRKLGSEPVVLSPQRYYALVEEIERIGKKLWLDSGGEIR